MSTLERYNHYQMVKTVRFINVKINRYLMKTSNGQENIYDRKIGSRNILNSLEVFMYGSKYLSIMTGLYILTNSSVPDALIFLSGGAYVGSEMGLNAIGKLRCCENKSSLEETVKYE